MTEIHDAERYESWQARQVEPCAAVCCHDYRRSRRDRLTCVHCGDSIEVDET